MERYSVVVPDHLNQVLTKHLIRPDGQEDLCFATYRISTANNRLTGILTEIILPQDGEREIHGNVGFLPNYFERVLSLAKKKQEGIVFLHSHPVPGWQGMSHDDVVAENRMAPAVYAITSLPLLGMTVGTDSAWSARFWIKDKSEKRAYNRKWCESVRVLSKKLSITFNDHLLVPSTHSEKQLRTISAWGEKTQQDLSRLTIGIVGLGSVGSIVAQILARTGITRFVLIDFDVVEEKNVDRTIVFEDDIGQPKVRAIRRVIQMSASSPNVTVEMYEYSICEKDGYLAALGCDVLFSCVDRPWPRQVLNYISYAHLIPVIDGGILVRTNQDNTKIKGADWKVQTVGYGRPCLECLGQYKTENAALEKAGLLDDPSYIANIDKSQFVDAHENVFAFSSNVASIEVLQLLNLFIAPSGLADVGQQMIHFVTGSMDQDKQKSCHPNCYFQSIIGKGDFTGVEVYGRHEVAEKARANRKSI